MSASGAIVEFNRLRDSLSVDWLSEELVSIVRADGSRITLGWFGSLEGDGAFEFRTDGPCWLWLRFFRTRDPAEAARLVNQIARTDHAPRHEDREPAA